MRMKTRTLITLATLAAPSLGLVGCGLEAIDDGGESSASIPAEVQIAFDQTCATAVACHDTGSSLVVLSAPESAAILESASTAGGAYVTIGDLEQSYIAQKILGGPDISGGPMPPSPQSDNDDRNLAVIVGWIAGVEIEGEGSEATGDGDGDPTGDGDGDPQQTCYIEDVPDMPSFETDIWPIVEPRCATEFCHGVVPPLMLDAVGSYDNFVDVTGAVSPLPYVTAGDADGSYLWHKLVGTQNSATAGGMGGKMPATGELCLTELEAFYAWINAGAML